MTEPFIGIADLSAYTRQTLDPDDALAIIACDAACEVVRGYTRQLINFVSMDEITVDGTGRCSLLLPELPVLEVLDVETMEDDGSDILVLAEGTDYRVGDGGILWRLDDEVWPRGHKNVTVTYDHGWGLETPGSGDLFEPVPSDIRLIALDIAASLFHVTSIGVGGVKSETIGNYSYTLADAAVVANATSNFTESHRRVLDKYRLRGFV